MKPTSFDLQAEQLDLYGADLGVTSLWRCVAECRRALEAVGRLSRENLERLASSTVEQVLNRDRYVPAS